MFFHLISPSLVLMTGVRVLSLGYVLGQAKRKVGVFCFEKHLSLCVWGGGGDSSGKMSASFKDF